MDFSTLVLPWVLPLALVVGGFLVGYAVNAVIRSSLTKIARRTNWDVDNLFFGAIGNMTVAWFVLGSLYLATFNIPISTKPGVLTAIHSLLLVATILSVTLVISRIAVALVHFYARRHEGVLPGATIFTNLVRLLVFVTGALIVLQSLGISVTPILTALGVGGLAVALALQDTLSNLFSGFQILASRQVGPGDYVKLESNDEGYVTDITWRNTTIRTIANNLIVVPNAKLATSTITNYHHPEQEMSVIVRVGVAYGSDLEKVEAVTRDVARETVAAVEGGVVDFDPLVRFHTFADFSIDFNVVFRAQEFRDQYLLRHEFIKRLHARYSSEGIEIPFPVHTLRMEAIDAVPVKLNGATGPQSRSLKSDLERR